MNTSTIEHNEQKLKKIIARERKLYLKFVINLSIFFIYIVFIMTDRDTGSYPDNDAPYIFTYNCDD